MRSPARLLVLYDRQCAFCRRCRHWLEQQPTWVPFSFLPAGSDEAKARFGDALPWLGEELVVVDERGNVWVGPAAFLVCLWGTRRYRDWSYRLSGQAFAPYAERFLHAVSSHRRSIARVIGIVSPAGGPHLDCSDGQCQSRRRR